MSSLAINTINTKVGKKNDIKNKEWKKKAEEFSEDAWVDSNQRRIYVGGMLIF